MIDQISVNTHSSIRIEGASTIYFDPFKIEAASHDADLILITHAHFDHFSPDDIEKIAKADTHYAAPESMKDALLKVGIKEENMTLMMPDQRADICGISVEAVPSYNIGKPMHPKKNGWLGYVIEVNGKRIYVAGDTDVTPEASSVRCDIALLPIGGTYTMNASEAAALVNVMKPETVIPIHYGSIVGSKKDVKKFTERADKEITVCIKL